jgi:CRP/FNR family transcriptional regulator, anaerobic regulatory protein
MHNSLRLWLDLHISLSLDEWDRVQKAWILKNLQKREFLFQCGDKCDFIAFVNRGCLRYFSVCDTGDAIYHFFFEDSFAWDMDSFLLQQPTQRNMQAIEPTQLLILSLEHLKQLEQDIPAWQKFRQIITEDAYHCVRHHAESLRLESVEVRYLKLVQKHPDLLERVPLHMVAAYIGIAPETLSRIRGRLNSSV